MKKCLYCDVNDRKLNKSKKLSDFCSRSCSSKYHSKSTIEKRKKTNIERYGVDNPSKSEEIIKKRNATNVSRYGVDNPFKLKEVQARQQNTCDRLYGNRFPIRTREIQKKQELTWNEKYGGHPWSNDNVREKRRVTLLTTYGVEHPIQNNNIREKIRITNLSRYGYVHASSNKNVSSKIRISQTSKLFDDLINDPVRFSELLDSEGLSELSDQCNVHKKTLVKYLIQCGLFVPFKSTFESEIKFFINQLKINYVEGSRWIIPPYELDMYLPDQNLALECNGSYWHSELQGRGKDYHLMKTRMCKEQGIHLIHIWEHDWNKKRDIVQSRIKSKLNLNDTIYARKTSVIITDSKCSSVFLNDNHIQGNCASSVKYGLYYNTELVALMTFGKSRYKKDIEWELIRYCSKLNINVVGGASKLFKHFIKKYNPSSIISYSDRMWNIGGLYESLGFDFKHSSTPAYYYTKDYVRFENRVAYQKHKLKDKLDTFDSNLTEWENMQANGYDRIWDCGNDVWLNFLD